MKTTRTRKTKEQKELEHQLSLPGRTALDIVRKFFPGVAKVTDATKPLMIEVTPADNKKSKALDHKHCALAVACLRSQTADGVIIGTRTAYLIFGHSATRYRLLESTSREIVSFDRRAGFAPGIYRLRAPSQYEQLGSKQSGGKNPTGRKQPGFRHITSNIRTVLGSGFTPV